MEDGFAFSNAIGLPEELVPVLVRSQVCEYASIRKDGTPITSPLIPFPGESGRTIDVNTGLAYSWKAERARNNSHVYLLYSGSKGLVGNKPPVILIYRQSTSHKSLTTIPTDWRIEMKYAFSHLGQPILTVVDEEGYPVPFRVRSGTLQAEGVNLNLLPTMPTEAKGRACLTFHTLHVQNGEMSSNENRFFIGTVSGDGESAIFKVERQLPNINFRRGLKDMLSLGKMMLSMKGRLEIEAKRRGQPVPVVRLLKH